VGRNQVKVQEAFLAENESLVSGVGVQNMVMEYPDTRNLTPENII